MSTNPRRVDAADRYVGQRVREFRLRAGKSQTMIANALGVTFQQVQKYERGDNHISAGRLTKVARVLDCTMADLLPPEDGSPARDGTVDAFMATRIGQAVVKSAAALPDDLAVVFASAMHLVASHVKRG